MLCSSSELSRSLWDSYCEIKMNYSSNANLDVFGENCKKVLRKYREITPFDVSLMGSDGNIVQSHGIILSACSPYFNKAITNLRKSNERNCVLLLPSYKTTEIQAVLNFICNGSLSGVDPVCKAFE